MASYLRLMRDPLVFGAVGLYCAMGSVGIVTQELFPLYAINGPERGGFQLTSRDLGLLNVAAGVPLLIYQLLCFPRLSKWLGVVGLQTQSLGYSASPSSTVSASGSGTGSGTGSSTRSASASSTSSKSPSASSSGSATGSATKTATASATGTRTATGTQTASATATATGSATRTRGWRG